MIGELRARHPRELEAVDGEELLEHRADLRPALDVLGERVDLDELGSASSIAFPCSQASERVVARSFVMVAQLSRRLDVGASMRDRVGGLAQFPCV